MIAALLSLRIYAYVAIAAGLAGFAYGWHVESVRYASFQGGVEALGKEAEKRTAERIAKDRKAKEEVSNAHQASISQRDARYAGLRSEYFALNDRMHEYARRSLVPAATDSAGRPVQGGGVVCFDRDRLNARLNDAAARYAERVRSAVGGIIGLVQRGDDGADAARWFGEWARKVDACPGGG